MAWEIALAIIPWMVSIGFIGTILSFFIRPLRPFRWPLIALWIGGIILYVIVQVFVLIGY
jgi:hypothetical protein